MVVVASVTAVLTAVLCIGDATWRCRPSKPAGVEGCIGVVANPATQHRLRPNDVAGAGTVTLAGSAGAMRCVDSCGSPCHSTGTKS